MSDYYAKVRWKNENQDFLDNRYSRAHQWEFDGGLSVPASSSPSVVPLPWSVEENVDPEEAFVASLSSCHMLWFLSIACKKKLDVESYTDSAVGTMAKNNSGKMAVTKVELNPIVQFKEGQSVSSELIDHVHHLAHEQCFIANSVHTEIIINPQQP